MNFVQTEPVQAEHYLLINFQQNSKLKKSEFLFWETNESKPYIVIYLL